VAGTEIGSGDSGAVCDCDLITGVQRTESVEDRMAAINLVVPQQDCHSGVVDPGVHRSTTRRQTPHHLAS
jgi:hypothetical protein